MGAFDEKNRSQKFCASVPVRVVRQITGEVNLGFFILGIGCYFTLYHCLVCSFFVFFQSLGCVLISFDFLLLFNG